MDILKLIRRSVKEIYNEKEIGVLRVETDV